MYVLNSREKFGLGINLRVMGVQMIFNVIGLIMIIKGLSINRELKQELYFGLF